MLRRIPLLLIKIVAFIAGLAFSYFPPELVAILMTPSPGSGQPVRRRTPASRQRRSSGHRRRRLYRNPRRSSG
jgi:hypothetical protein